MTEVESSAVLDTILRPHLSLDPDGEWGVQRGGVGHASKMNRQDKVRPKIVSMGGKPDNGTQSDGEAPPDPNSGGTAE